MLGFQTWAGTTTPLGRRVHDAPRVPRQAGLGLGREDASEALTGYSGEHGNQSSVVALLMSAVSCLDWGNRPLARLTAVPQASGPASGPVDDVAPEAQQIDDALHAMHLLVRATRPNRQSPSPSVSDLSEDEEHSPADMARES